MWGHKVTIDFFDYFLSFLKETINIYNWTLAQLSSARYKKHRTYYCELLEHISHLLIVTAVTVCAEDAEKNAIISCSLLLLDE